MTIITIILIVVVLIILWLVLSYNSLIRFRNRAKEAFSDIDVQLKRRYDLIPNLVETVKGYAGHESGVFEKVTQARATAISTSGMEDKAKAENVLSGTLKTLFAVAENYPSLRANDNFLELQRELADTENKIQAARRFYNSNILSLNTKIEIFPTNLIAGLFHFNKMEFFGADEIEKEPVKAQF